MRTLALLITALLLSPALILCGSAEREPIHPKKAAEPWGTTPGAVERTTPSGGPPAAGQSGRVIVRYVRGADVGQARAEVLENVVGARSLEFLRSANARVFAVRAPVRAAVGAAEALPGVEYAEESRRGFELFNPGDTLYDRGKQWGLKQINAQKAWNTSRGDIGAGPDVGVLGTGYFRHPDLSGKVVSEYV